MKRHVRTAASRASVLWLVLAGCAACSGEGSESTSNSLSADAGRDAASEDARADRAPDSTVDEDAASDGGAPPSDASRDSGDGESDAQLLDADAPDAEVPDAVVPDGALSCGDTVQGSGCANGVRAGFLDVELFPNIAACAGAWQGDVSNGQSLCAQGFHVCRASDPVVRSTTFMAASAFCGCYAFDAAQDNYTCLDDCSAQAPATDAADRIDMAGMGGDCPYRFIDAASCIAGGRIDATENDGIGCNYDPRLSGVVCCADLGI